MAKTLYELFADWAPEYVPDAAQDVQVEHIAFDSRRVQPGTLFVAIPGTQTDGHRYIPDALQRGAVAVVGQRPLPEPLPVPYIRVPDAREALARMAAAFYDHPSRSMRVIGVTGTDGKTTTVTLIYHILRAAGHPTGMISTVQADLGHRTEPTGLHVTTPDALQVQRYLAEMRDAGLTHVVLEATSHGLAQHRVTGVAFDIGVITNITHEHLDYHGSYEGYRAAKARLLTLLAETPPKPWGNPRLSVINRDDAPVYPYLRRVAPGPVVTYGLHPEAQVRAREVQSSPQGLRFSVEGPSFQYVIQSPLRGAYNVHNILAALAATVVGLGISIADAARGVAQVKQIPGRMEPIDLGQNFWAIVDFAHTPKALEAALRTAREWTQGRVIAVFGSAGLRDRMKRRMMAEISAQLADITILTAEDPRTEPLDAILAEMAEGARAQGGVEGRTFYRVPDRGDAIRLAVRLAQPGDIVLVCGKGHEQSMNFDGVEYPWDDRVALRAALAEYLGKPGPKMPYLPTQGPPPAKKEYPPEPLPWPGGHPPEEGTTTRFSETWLCARLRRLWPP
ncbi:MAG: UDP-N-acetylmuramoyl-L-alanyl-D-glutamate--2,6-diaminopimelate ligase [Chloroflexi bacterium]|nr:UDP-N-acetylmuramoyl-L-alanyl-D-glutamate--2,6-diaminopimelate ligase [Chloroflexota bacterium]